MCLAAALTGQLDMSDVAAGAKYTAGAEETSPTLHKVRGVSGLESMPDRSRTSEPSRLAFASSSTRTKASRDSARSKETEKARLELMFDEHDADNSGALSTAELKAFMQGYVTNHEIHGLQDLTVSDAEVK